jgi:hypothetical protein
MGAYSLKTRDLTLFRSGVPLVRAGAAYLAAVTQTTIIQLITDHHTHSSLQAR